MAEKQAPPAYGDVSKDGQPPAPAYPGYAPPPGGDPNQAGGYPPQQAGGYPPQQAGGYPPQQAGYPPNYNAQYGQYPPQQAQYGQYSQQYGQTVVVTQPAMVTGPVQNVPDNMGLAIFTTICCCWPLGIVAILRAQECRRAKERGDATAAQNLGAQSRKFSTMAIVGGIFCFVIAGINIYLAVQRYNSYSSRTSIYG